MRSIAETEKDGPLAARTYSSSW